MRASISCGATAEPRDDGLRVRRRLLRFLVMFVSIQAAIATIISIRARRDEQVRAARRPETYPSRSFERVELDHRPDGLRLFMRGDELLAAMLNSIEVATRCIYVETFIWANDPVGRSLRDALARAAERGVDVFVLWDWALSDRSISDGFFPDSIEAYPFKEMTLHPRSLRLRMLLRDHRKLVVIDDDVAYVGGYNFGEEHLGWRDTHLRVERSMAREVANVFCDFWNQHTPSAASSLANVEGRDWDPHVAVHRNDPSLGIFPIRGMYLEAIDRAATRAWLTTAYFVPDVAFRTSLKQASRRGVDVRVLLPAHSNHPLTDVLAHGIFEDLLKAGVRVFLYRDFMVHAKTAVIDDSWSTIGTANLDRWSMLGNYEINLEVRCKALAQQMIEMYELDLAYSDEVQLDAWQRRPLHWRTSERVLRSLAPLM